MKCTAASVRISLSFVDLLIGIIFRSVFKSLYESHKKKPGNINFGTKVPIYSSHWDKISLELKSWILDSWGFFPLNNMGRRGQVWDVFIKRTFLLRICIFNKARDVFNIKPLFFHGCKHSLFPCIFHSKKTFFRGLFCTKSYWNQGLFISRTFFHKTFSSKI